MAAAATAAGCPPDTLAARATPFADPDQVRRHASAVKRNDQRTLRLDEIYDSGQMQGARVLVTGANRGIGLTLAQEAVACGAHVIAACRKRSPQLDDLGKAVTIVEGVDVQSEESCKALSDALEGTEPLDVVVNNAGYFPDVADDLTTGPNYAEAMKQYDICALGPLRVTHALLAAGRIKTPGGKVILITSQGGSLEWRQVQNKNKGGDYGHHMCKAAANMCGCLLAEELRPRGIAVACLHPGFNRTDMTRKYEAIWDVEGAVESGVGAKRVMHEIGLVKLTDAGCPFVNCEDGLAIPW